MQESGKPVGISLADRAKEIKTALSCGGDNVVKTEHVAQVLSAQLLSEALCRVAFAFEGWDVTLHAEDDVKPNGVDSA